MISEWNGPTHRYGTRILPRPSGIGHHKDPAGRERSDQVLPRILPAQYGVEISLERRCSYAVYPLTLNGGYTPSSFGRVWKIINSTCLEPIHDTTHHAIVLVHNNGIEAFLLPEPTKIHIRYRCEIVSETTKANHLVGVRNRDPLGTKRSGRRRRGRRSEER